MILNGMSSSLEWVSGSRSPAVKGSLKPSRCLPDGPLMIIGQYLPAEDLQRLASLCGRIEHLAFHSSPEGFEALWTSLYRRDHAPSMALAEKSLPQPNRFSSHTLPSRGFPALRLQAQAALERSSMWPATRADVLAHLYPARLSVRTYGSQQLLQGHSWASDITQLADGSVASGSYDGSIRIGPSDGGVSRVLEGHNDKVLCIIQLADGRIASASRDRTIRIWTLDGRVSRVLIGHLGYVLRIIQLADGRIASASYDHTIRIWPLDAGWPLDAPLVLEGHTHRVIDIIQLADGRIASASADGRIRIWPLGGGAPRVLTGHKATVCRIIQLADGRIASASADGTIRIWTLDGDTSRVLAGHHNSVRRIIRLADGRIASASRDGTIRIWTLDEDTSRVLAGHHNSVLRIIQLADGRIASASRDGTIRIWPLDGDSPQVLRVHNGWVHHLIQLADGRIVSVSDGPAHIWACHNPNTDQLVLTAIRQARYRKATHQISRKAILALGFVLLAWGVNALLRTIVRGSTHTT